MESEGEMMINQGEAGSNEESSEDIKKPHESGQLVLIGGESG